MDELQNKYASAFGKLRRGMTSYGSAPHKIILLLAMIYELEEGRLPENRIELTDSLQKTFQKIWHAHIPAQLKYQPNIALPFYHLKNDGFWHLQVFHHRREWFESQKSINYIGTLQKTVQYATLDQELYELLMNPTFRTVAREILISQLSQRADGVFDENCPFCKESSKLKVVAETELALAFYDRYPVTEGHTLIIPKRHVASYFELEHEEVVQIHDLSCSCRDILWEQHHPAGFNLGVNIGAEAGQTVFHCHVHLIPRYQGDVSDPRGGVRGVIPYRQYY